VSKLALSGFRGLHRWDNDRLAGTCLFYEWFVTVLWVVFGFEQSPRQASFAKHSLLLARFWKNFFAVENRVCWFNDNHAPSQPRDHARQKTDPNHRTQPEEGKKIILKPF
jgi:hypothetical protein